MGVKDNFRKIKSTFQQSYGGDLFSGESKRGSNSPQLAAQQTERSWGEYSAACSGEVYSKSSTEDFQRHGFNYIKRRLLEDYDNDHEGESSFYDCTARYKFFKDFFDISPALPEGVACGYTVMSPDGEHWALIGDMLIRLEKVDGKLMPIEDLFNPKADVIFPDGFYVFKDGTIGDMCSLVLYWMNKLNIHDLSGFNGIVDREDKRKYMAPYSMLFSGMSDFGVAAVVDGVTMINYLDLIAITPTNSYVDFFDRRQLPIIAVNKNNMPISSETYMRNGFAFYYGVLRSATITCLVPCYAGNVYMGASNIHYHTVISDMEYLRKVIPNISIDTREYDVLQYNDSFRGYMNQQDGYCGPDFKPAREEPLKGIGNEPRRDSEGNVLITLVQDV